MSKRTFGILPLALIAGVVLSGCTSSQPGPTPEPKTVNINGTNIWVSGYWYNAGGNWIWLNGHQEVRPRAEAVWVPGHWDKSPDGSKWVWIQGYWN